jgi:hypothetical protein
MAPPGGPMTAEGHPRAIFQRAAEARVAVSCELKIVRLANRDGGCPPPAASWARPARSFRASLLLKAGGGTRCWSC